jgi:hypothetical protein
VNWLVLRVVPQKEFEAEKRIKDRGHDALCPFEEKWRRRNSRSRHKRLWKYPCFTRYVFAGIRQWPWDWNDIETNVDLVQGYLRRDLNGDQPFFLSSADVRHLSEMGDAKLSQDGAAVLHRAIMVGSSATVGEGIYRGHTVTVESIVGNSANVALQLFNSMVSAKISLAKLDPV